jgi:hypothetical protein
MNAQPLINIIRLFTISFWLPTKSGYQEPGKRHIPEATLPPSSVTPVASDFGPFPPAAGFQGRNDAASETSRSPGSHEENLRLFFGRFLIGHLATNPDMDGYLGFMSPEALALSHGYP